MNTRIVKRGRRAFTLIEILIVVVILGILAAIVIPQFTNASDDANANSAAAIEQTVRSQLELYRVRNGAYPAAVDALFDNSHADFDGTFYLQEAPTIPAGFAATYDVTAQPIYQIN